jgi:hypothetical protein
MRAKLETKEMKADIKEVIRPKCDLNALLEHEIDLESLITKEFESISMQ